ncbi:WD40/YVTN/BNR-like repeat-containing protein [Tropicimonas isoalkanivorans]|uniref:Uncharacterized protein n=1 Tax=Tropicimonas isoalkanivorans TaxID=441112 RepID=A0A1I1HRI3_9RHOB|nr:glycosyl hydrolase [Tropicimonas isoalkanivorans]SFC26162.1 hypothetical protein SAMN04488094_103247 [Tropicimonas isoalkanivorans]
MSGTTTLSRRGFLGGGRAAAPVIAGWQALDGAPTMQGDVFWAVHALGDTLFIGGDEGTILSFDGTVWDRRQLSTRTPVHAFTGDFETGLIAVGWMGSIWRHGDGDWTLERGCKLRADGKYAADDANTPLFAATADGQGRFWAVGDNGLILHFDGTDWAAEPSGTPFHLRAVTMLGDGRVMAAGANGTVLIRDPDGIWAAATCPVATTITSVLAIAPDDVLLAGGRYFVQAGRFLGDLLRWDGAHIHKLDPGSGATRFRALRALGNGALAVGDRGQSIHIRGKRVSALPSETQHDLLGLDVTEAGEVIAVGDFATLLVGNAKVTPAPALRPEPAPNWERMETGTDRQLWGIWQHPQTGIAYACGEEGTVLALDGDRWTKLPPAGVLGLHALAASDDGGLLAAGQLGEVHHFDGERWRLHFDLKLDVTIMSLWSDGDATVIAVGDEGLILRWNGSDWARMTSGTRSALYGLWGRDREHLLAVGDFGLVLRWNGTAWQEFSSGTENFLFDVWGSALDDIFVVGLSGTICHFDGRSWRLTPARARNDLLAISGSGARTVAVGTAGAAMSFDGRRWQSERTGFDGGLRSVSAMPHQILAAGDRGTILRRRES